MRLRAICSFKDDVADAIEVYADAYMEEDDATRWQEAMLDEFPSATAKPLETYCEVHRVWEPLTICSAKGCGFPVCHQQGLCESCRGMQDESVTHEARP